MKLKDIFRLFRKYIKSLNVERKIHLFTKRISVIVNTLQRYLLTYSSDGTTSCGPGFETEVVLTCDLIALTFDLSTSKWGHHELCVPLVSFLPVFSVLRLFILDLGSSTGQTDGQTDDGHQGLMSPSYGDGA